MPSAASKIVAGNRFHGTAEQMEGAYRRVAVRVFSKQRQEVADALAKAAVNDKVLAAALRSINRSWTSGDGKLYREWFEGYRGLTAKSFELGQEGLSRSVGFDIFNPRLLDAADERAEQLALYIGGTNARLVTQSIRDIEVEHGSSRVDAIVAAIKGEAFNPEMTLVRAERIARTETVGSLNAGEYSAAVESEVFEVKEWLHSGNNRDPRDWHMAMDGERVGINDRFSNGLLHPGEQGVDAAEVINCGCAVLYHVDAEAAAEGDRDTSFHTPVFHDEPVVGEFFDDPARQAALAESVQAERLAMFDEMRSDAEAMDATMSKPEWLRDARESMEEHIANPNMKADGSVAINEAVWARIPDGDKDLLAADNVAISYRKAHDVNAGSYGVYEPAYRRITTTIDRDAAYVEGTVTHEIGHAVDFALAQQQTPRYEFEGTRYDQSYSTLKGTEWSRAVAADLKDKYNVPLREYQRFMNSAYGDPSTATSKKQASSFQKLQSWEIFADVYATQRAGISTRAGAWTPEKLAKAFPRASAVMRDLSIEASKQPSHKWGVR